MTMLIIKTNKPLLILVLLGFVFFSTNSLSSCKIISNIKGNTIITGITGDKDIASFEWLVFDEGKVIQTGNDLDKSKFSHCQKLDGKGAYLLPGLIDAHGHVSGLGNEMLRVKLRDIKSESLAVEQVKQFALKNKKSQWILGRGWNQVLWLNKKFPTKNSLDSSGIERPIVLRRIDGHAAWVNSLALKIAGIDNKRLIHKVVR